MSPAKNNSKLKEEVYQYIKSAIFTKKLRPFVIYSVSDMESLLNVSRTPIREALQKLENDQYIELIHRKGFMIRLFSFKELNELFEVRVELDALVLKKVIAKSDTSFKKKLHECLLNGAEYIDIDDFENAQQQDALFHELLTDFADNNYLSKTLKECRELIAVSTATFGKDINVLAQSRKSHLAIYQAIELKDIDAGIKALMRHNELIIEWVKERSSEMEENDDPLMGLSHLG